MPFALPTDFSATTIRLRRAARRLLWPRPSLYYPIGLLRKRGNVLESRTQFYISGYPRCGNTFARTAFDSVNPGVRVRSHKHIPSFVLHSLKCGIPGIVLIRTPLDAAISWAIHQNESLEEAIAYWNDYYEPLLRVRSDLFLARFEDVTRDFGAVINAVNERFATAYVSFQHTAENAARCFQLTDDNNRAPGGDILEMRVCRPSTQRRVVKEKHLDQLDQSDFLREELARAGDLYETLLHYRAKCDIRSSTRLIPARQETEAPGVAAAY